MGHLQYSLEDFEEEEKKAQERNTGTGTGTYVLFQLSEFGTRFLKTLQTDQVRIRIRNTRLSNTSLNFIITLWRGRECRMVVSYHLFFSHQVKQFFLSMSRFRICIMGDIVLDPDGGLGLGIHLETTSVSY